MGVMDKFKSFIGVPDDEFYDEEDDFDFIGNRSNDRDDDYDDPKSERCWYAGSGRYSYQEEQVVNIAATTQLQVVLVSRSVLKMPAILPTISTTSVPWY